MKPLLFPRPMRKLAAISLSALLLGSGGCSFVSRSHIEAGDMTKPYHYAGVPFAVDTTFGTTGKTVTSGSQDDDVAAVVVQGDKAVVVGNARVAGVTGSRPFLMRFDAKGAPDTTFGNSHDGKVTLDLGAEGRAMAAALYGDVLLVAGTRFNGVDHDFFVAKFDASGNLAADYGAQGKVIVDFGGEDEPRAILQTANGLVLVGISSVTGLVRLAVTRLAPSGIPDPGFGVAGRTTATFSAPLEASSLASLSDGSIVIAGKSFNGAKGYDFALAHCFSNGHIDPGFGGTSDGLVRTDFGGSDEATGVGVQTLPDGDRIVLAGSSYRLSTRYDLAIARYTRLGVLDTRFAGGRGYVVDDLDGHDEDRWLTLTIDPVNQIFAGGTTFRNGGFQILAGRYSADGVLDRSSNLLYSIAGKHARATAQAVTDDGRIVIAGKVILSGGISEIAVARYIP